MKQAREVTIHTPSHVADPAANQYTGPAQRSAVASRALRARLDACLVVQFPAAAPLLYLGLLVLLPLAPVVALGVAAVQRAASAYAHVMDGLAQT